MAMACSEGRQLAAYLDAGLSLPDRARLEEHLAHCSCCRQELAELEQLEGLLAELSPLPAPP
ncbi:MAG: anti-sigma factor family protein, partial [Bacteroidota bacterium]